MVSLSREVCRRAASHSCPRSAPVNLPVSAQPDPGQSHTQSALPHISVFARPVKSSMSDYGGLSSNGVGGGVKKDAFADAVQRARQVSPVFGYKRS